MINDLLVVEVIVTTETFLWVDVVKLTFGLLLMAEQLTDVRFINLESENWKSTWSTWVHKLFESQKPELLLFKPFESVRLVFVSYKDRTTSGFEFRAEHTNL